MDIVYRNNKPSPLVSIIIPTYNSSKYLAFTLNSLVEQTYKNIEIIVVDNYSSDNTREIAKRYGAYVSIQGDERASQINYGVALAKGKYIYETGSDMISTPTYIEECVNMCENGGYVAIYSSVISKAHNNFWCKVKALERLTYIGDNEIESPHFFTKFAFIGLGGFDTNLISVEEDMLHKLEDCGYEIGRIQGREIHLHEATSLKEVALKSYYYGIYIKSYLKKHPKRGTSYLFPIRKAFLKKMPLLLSHPLLTFGLVIYKFVQYTFGILGLLSNNKKGMHKKVYG